MLPEIKVQHLYKEVAKNLKLEESIVRNIYDFYKEELGKEFGDCLIINVPGLGRYESNYRKLFKLWADNEKKVIKFLYGVQFLEGKYIKSYTEKEFIQSLNRLKNIENKIEKLTKYEKYRFLEESFPKFTGYIRRSVFNFLEERAYRDGRKRPYGYMQDLSEILRQYEKDRELFINKEGLTLYELRMQFGVENSCIASELSRDEVDSSVN